MQADLNVVLHRHGVEQANVLERTGNTHAVDLVDRLARGVLTIEQDGAVRRLVHLGEQVEDRGLAGTVGADETGDLGLADSQAKVIDCLKATELNARWMHSSAGRSPKSRSGTMAPEGYGTILPLLNSNLLGIGCHLLLGSKAVLDATEESLELRVVGKDHDQDQHDSVDEHAVV